MAKAKTPAIKFYEVINWLLGPDKELPEVFVMNKTKLNNIVPYIHEQLWINPKLTSYLNTHINDLHNIPDPIEQLILLKKIFRLNRITKWDLWSFFPERKPDLVKEIEEVEGYDENDARAKAMLIKKFNIPMTKYIKPVVTKTSVKKDTEAKKRVQEVLDQENKKKEIQEREKMKESSKTRYLPKVTQELVDEMGLILFDISLLKKTNRVLFTFIDKANKKYYRIEPFMAKIYISCEDGVVNNDYIEELNSEKFTEYIINDIQNYTRLKYMLNDSYSRILNLESR